MDDSEFNRGSFRNGEDAITESLRRCFEKVKTNSEILLNSCPPSFLKVHSFLE
jgi:hypothetical protein